MNSYQKKVRHKFPHVFAALLYGSKILGYANRESDTDIIVVLKNYQPKVKYVYEDNYSYLVVDKKIFEDDVAKTKYGDFIAARLTSPYIAFINKDYIQKQEIKMKKKIVEVYTTQLIHEQGEKTKNCKINLLYFPYCKWNEQTTIYKPLAYSVLRMLAPQFKEKNLAKILPGYKKAIAELNILDKKSNDWYQIKPDYIEKILKHKKFFPKLEFYLKEINNAVSRYKTHNLAGASQTDIIIAEILHKIKREFQKKRVGKLDPPEIYLKFN